jgi:hypothetical protein
MHPSTLRTPADRLRLIKRGARILWAAVRLPTAALLLALEPLVSLVLTGAFLLGTAGTLILRLSGDLPDFPFWRMLAFAIVTLLALSAYHTLLGLLST